MRHPEKLLLALGLAALLTGSTGALLGVPLTFPVWASEAINEVAADVGPHPSPSGFAATPSPSPDQRSGEGRGCRRRPRPEGGGGGVRKPE